MTPLPTGTSAVLTGVPLGAAPPDVADDVADPEEADDDVPAAAVVVELDAAPPEVVGVFEPPHAASAAAAAAPAPPTPAARSTVRRRRSAGPPGLEEVVSGCSDMAGSCLVGEGRGLFPVPKLVAGSTNLASPMLPRAAVNHLW
jgi:hypothetical protein